MDDTSKSKLKALRDKLAAAAPRARIRPNTPRELLRRLDDAVKQVGNLYLMCVSRTASSEAGSAIDDAIDDALVEGHLLLHEVERAASDPGTARPSPGADRRIHARHDTNVVVRLLRHSTHLQDTGSIALTSEIATRSAENVSVGGVFVRIPQHELPQVAVGSVVHIEIVSAAGVTPFRVRAAVMRRDGNGIGLRWIEDSDRVKRDIVKFLEETRALGRGLHAR